MKEGLTPHIRNRIVENVCHLIIQNYPFEDVANEMVADLKKHLAQGKYGDCTQVSKLGETLTHDLRDCSHDRHILIYYNPNESVKIEKLNKQQLSEDIYPEHWWSLSNSDNYGIIKLEYLEGNIGYIKINLFAPVTIAGDTVVSAMAFLSAAEAIIFDLRECSGGDPFTVQLFESYLFSKKRKPKLLLTKHSKVEYPIQQTWSLPYIPGNRLSDKPVYILTSGNTFSGGEDMAYTLKHHHRALIIGERTAGGAHPIEEMSVGDGFVLILPNAYPEHPETRNNWEGVGVTPDIEVRREDALAIAHKTALEQLLDHSDKERSHTICWHIDRIHAIYKLVEISEKELIKFTGTYRDWKVEFKEGALYLSQIGGVGVEKLQPITQK